MELFLVPNNPERTVLVSKNGVAHYRVRTYRGHAFRRPDVSRIRRPDDSDEDSIVADIAWKYVRSPTVVRSNLLFGLELSVKVKDFLYRRGRFSSSRYFAGNDGREYRWKPIKDSLVLTEIDTGEEVARYMQGLPGEGLFIGQRKSCLRIEPSNLDIDLVVLSFIIMEKKRRDRAGDGTTQSAHDEDPQGEGGAEAGDGGAAS